MDKKKSKPKFIQQVESKIKELKNKNKILPLPVIIAELKRVAQDLMTK